MQIGKGVNLTTTPNITKQTPQALNPIVARFGIYLQNLNAQPLKEGNKQLASHNRNTHIRIRLHEGSKRVGHHCHIAHSRKAHHRNMSGQFFRLLVLLLFVVFRFFTACYHKVLG